MAPHIVIEMQVNLDRGRKLIRSAIQPTEIELLTILKPLKHNTDLTFAYLEGQSNSDRAIIHEAREKFAKRIAAELTDHLLTQWLEADDTLDGYKKGERGNSV